MNTINIDFGKAVTYPFEDKDWIAKLAILLVLGIIPIVNLVIVPGYMIIAADNIRQGIQPPLPEWADFNGIAYRGLMIIGATLLYHLPLILVGCCGALASTMAPGGRSGAGLVLGIQCCVGGVAIVYGIVANLLLNVGHVRFLQTDKFESYMDIAGRIRDLQAEPNLYVMLLIYQLVAGVALGLLSVVLAITCIGPLLIIPLYTTINAYLLGLTAASAPVTAKRA